MVNSLFSSLFWAVHFSIVKIFKHLQNKTRQFESRNSYSYSQKESFLKIQEPKTIRRPTNQHGGQHGSPTARWQRRSARLLLTVISQPVEVIQDPSLRCFDVMLIDDYSTTRHTEDRPADAVGFWPKVPSHSVKKRSIHGGFQPPLYLNEIQFESDTGPCNWISV